MGWRVVYVVGHDEEMDETFRHLEACEENVDTVKSDRKQRV